MQISHAGISRSQVAVDAKDLLGIGVKSGLEVLAGFSRQAFD